jgi:hypothetical protein
VKPINTPISCKKWVVVINWNLGAFVIYDVSLNQLVNFLFFNQSEYSDSHIVFLFKLYEVLITLKKKKKKKNVNENIYYEIEGI